MPGPSLDHARCDVVALSSLDSTSDPSTEPNTRTHARIDFVETSENVDQTSCNTSKCKPTVDTMCLCLSLSVSVSVSECSSVSSCAKVPSHNLIFNLTFSLLLVD